MICAGVAPGDSIMYSLTLAHRSSSPATKVYVLATDWMPDGDSTVRARRFGPGCTPSEPVEYTSSSPTAFCWIRFFS